MKGQTDTFGLLLIVVMLAFIGVIFLGLMLLSPGEDDSQFLSSKANNMVNAVVKASACQRTLEDAMISCCRGDLFCSVDACEYVEGAIRGIKEDSGEDMEFNLLNRDEGDECVPSVGSCDFGVSSSGFLLRDESGVYDVRVKLCTGE